MKMGRPGSALRRYSLPVLVAEAVWRAVRSMRQASFRRQQNGGLCSVRFQPIGYYQREELQGELLNTFDRQTILAYADSVLVGIFPIMGYGSVDLGNRPDWQCDWVSGKTWPMDSSETLKVVRHDGSDVKAPWELSRLQFAPILAKAFVITGDSRYRDAVRSLLTDWITMNPIGKGVNWTVAMEAGLRAISICLTLELLWPFAADEEPWLAQMTGSLWQHLRFIKANSEFSFLLRSNHYLSNMVGLTTLSAYLQGSGMKQRLGKYARAVQRELLLQTYPDGGDQEASTGYHVLVAQMFLHSYVVQQRSGCVIPPSSRDRLQQMFTWISVLADDSWKLPLLGDCDNGRVELEIEDLTPEPPYALQIKSLYQRAAQLLQLAPITHDSTKNAVTLLPNSGVAVLRLGRASVIFCAMPNGIHGKGSHTHCDKLSILLRLGNQEVFCDSGSRGYSRFADLRNLDRSTRAHSTLMVDEEEQNTISSDLRSLFETGNEAIVSPILRGDTTARAAHRGYARVGVEHQRSVQLHPDHLLVLDVVKGTGKHSLDLRYILAPGWQVNGEQTRGKTVTCDITGLGYLHLQCNAETPLNLSVVPAEISHAYGSSVPTVCIRIQTQSALPAKVQTRVEWD